MRYDPRDPTWQQFRRLLLGTVIEGLVEADVPVDLPSVEIGFDRESDFRVPRLDNYLRFKGRLTAKLTGAPPAGVVARLEQLLRPRWRELLEALAPIPLGDRLDPTRDELVVRLEGPHQIAIAFDLEAD